MKRGGPPERRTGLRRKQPLLRDAQQLRRKTELARSTERKRKATAEGARKRPPWRVPFRAVRQARTVDCFRCPRRAHHWHHLIPQDVLRRHVQSLQRHYPEEDLRRIARDLLRDERNLVPACIACHEAIESGARPVRADEVTRDPYDFAHELGPWAVVRLEIELHVSAAENSGTPIRGAA